MKVSFVNKVKFHIKKLYRKAKLPGDDSSQKMPSCTCLKASYTLEAAVIFPLVAGFFVFILFFFRVVQVESQVKAALYYSARMSALASSANDSSVVSVATAEVLFRSRISDSKHIDTYVSGGRYGVSLLGSSMDGDDVSLKAKYKVKLVTLMGLFVTADIVCSTMVMGLTIAGTISVILIASGRAGRKKQIAFTPFLLLGYGLTEVFM